MVSPLRRTLQTAEIVLGELTQKHSVPVVLQPLLQEVSSWPCDRGSHPADLEEQFQSSVMGYDFRTLAASWALKVGLNAPGAVEERAGDFRKWLCDRPEQRVILVGHGVMFRALLGATSSCTPSHLGAFFRNCELRRYALNSDHAFCFAAAAEAERITHFFAKSPIAKAAAAGEKVTDGTLPERSDERSDESIIPHSIESDEAVARELHRNLMMEEMEASQSGKTSGTTAKAGSRKRQRGSKSAHSQMKMRPLERYFEPKKTN